MKAYLGRLVPSGGKMSRWQYSVRPCQFTELQSDSQMISPGCSQGPSHVDGLHLTLEETISRVSLVDRRL